MINQNQHHGRRDRNEPASTPSSPLASTSFPHASSETPTRVPAASLPAPTSASFTADSGHEYPASLPSSSSPLSSLSSLYKGNLTNLAPALIASATAWTASGSTSWIASTISESSTLGIALAASFASYVWYPTFYFACYLRSDRSALQQQKCEGSRSGSWKLLASYTAQTVILEGMFFSGMIAGQLFAMRSLDIAAPVATLLTNSTLSLFFGFCVNTPVRNLMHWWTGFTHETKAQGSSKKTSRSVAE